MIHVQAIYFAVGLLDRSLAIRKVNSSAIGHLARVAKDVSLSKCLTKMKQWYLEREGEWCCGRPSRPPCNCYRRLYFSEQNAKHASASVMYAVGRHCPDALNRHTTLVLPLAFYGMHETQAGQGSKRNAVGNSLTKYVPQVLVDFAANKLDLSESKCQHEVLRA